MSWMERARVFRWLIVKSLMKLLLIRIIRWLYWLWQFISHHIVMCFFIRCSSCVQYSRWSVSSLCLQVFWFFQESRVCFICETVLHLVTFENKGHGRRLLLVDVFSDLFNLWLTLFIVIMEKIQIISSRFGGRVVI
jgi:hypothetical protein